MLRQWLTEELDHFAAAGLLREPIILQGPVGPEVPIDGQQVLLFSSNDYLGLATHPALRQAGAAALAEYGAGATSSRLICGTLSLHRELEERLARWLGCQAALLFTSGFNANQAVLATLPGPGDVILSDQLNHASIVQGCRLSRAQVAVYAHGDTDQVRQLLRQHRRARRRFLVTDALFSVDGDVAPLTELDALARQYDAALMVDEAHSLGIAGPAGRGLCASLGVTPDILVGAFGKAFGVAGAFVAGSAELRSFLQSRAVPFIYTTAPPPVVVALAAEALRLVQAADQERRTLLAHSRRLRIGLSEAGCPLAPGRWHIVPALVPGIPQALSLQRRLLRRGVWVPALRPPTVPAGAERLRWTASAGHRTDQIDRALAAFAEAYGKGDFTPGRSST